MTINPIKTLLAVSVALPIVAVASFAQAAPQISDHNFFPSDVHAERHTASVFDARASIDMPMITINATHCNYAGGPKLDTAFCR